MTATCISCTHFDMQREPSMAKHRFGQCLQILGRPTPTCDHVGRYISISRPYGCDKHTEAAADIVAKRVEWAERNKQKGKA